MEGLNNFKTTVMFWLWDDEPLMNAITILQLGQSNFTYQRQ